MSFGSRVEVSPYASWCGCVLVVRGVEASVA